VAALLDVAPVSDVTAIESPDTFVRPIYAGTNISYSDYHILWNLSVGNALCTVQSSEPIKVLTVRTSAFPAAEPQPPAQSVPVRVVKASAPSAATASKWLREEVAQSDRPELGSAKIVISGGRGLKNGDNFKLLYALADKLGAAGSFIMIIVSTLFFASSR
jgi:electron transfer flavoprotein alpha subunit